MIVCDCLLLCLVLVFVVWLWYFQSLVWLVWFVMGLVRCFLFMVVGWFSWFWGGWLVWIRVCGLGFG